MKTRREHWLLFGLLLRPKSSFAHCLVLVQEEEGISGDETAYTSGSLLRATMGSATETLAGVVKAIIFSRTWLRPRSFELKRMCGLNAEDYVALVPPRLEVMVTPAGSMASCFSYTMVGFCVESGLIRASVICKVSYSLPRSSELRKKPFMQAPCYFRLVTSIGRTAALGARRMQPYDSISNEYSHPHMSCLNMYSSSMYQCDAVDAHCPIAPIIGGS